MDTNVPMIYQIEKLNWLSNLYFLRNDYKNCEKIYSLAQSDYNKYINGLICLRNKEIKKCLHYINLIHSKNQKDYCKLEAKCIFLLGNHSKLIQLMKEKYIKQFSSDWNFWQMLGISYLHNLNITMAKEAFQHALEITNQISPYLYLSKCYLSENNVNSAISVLKKANEIEPNNVDLKIKLGLLLYTNNMKSKGVDILMELYNKSAVTIDNLQMSLTIGAVIQEYQSDVDNALYRYKLANIFENPIICNNVALCFIEKKKYIAAVSCLKRGLYLNVFDWRLNYNLGLLYLQLKQYVSAFHYLKNSLAMSGKMKNIFSLLAICLENLNDNVNAQHAHEKAIKNDVENQDLSFPIINYCIYLYNNDHDKNKNKIIELLSKFEQISKINKKNMTEIEKSLINTANFLYNKLIINFDSELKK